MPLKSCTVSRSISRVPGGRASNRPWRVAGSDLRLSVPPLLAPRSLAAAVALLLACGWARAEEAKSDASRSAASVDERAPSDEEDTAEIVITATRSPEPQDASTIHTGVVTRQEAERRGAVTVAEALEGEPGVQVNPNSYGFVGAPSGIVMQGLDAERVLVLRDGERFIGDQDGVTDLSQISIGDIQRIEYVFGPTSSLYGTGALGGVVNVVTGPPRAEGVAARGRLEVRSLPEVVGQASSTYRSGGTWGGVFASYQFRDEVAQFDDRPDTTLPERQQVDAAGKIGVSRGPAHSYAEVRWTRRRSDGLETQDVPGLGRFTTDVPDVVERLHLRSRQEVSFAQSAYLRLALSGQFFSGEGTRDRRDSPLDEVRDRDQSLLSAEALGSYAEGPRFWIAGVRIEREAFEQALTRTAIVDGEPVATTQDEVVPTRLGNGAIYAQLTWSFDDVLKVVPGIRGEMHNRFGAVVAPRLAASWQPADAWRVRASVGRGFRAPGAKEYGFVFDHSFLGYRVIGNPDLEPETSVGVNGDVIFLPNSRTRLRVGGFYNWVESLIATDFLEQSRPGVDDFGYVNVGSARTAGMDSSVTWYLLPTLRSELAHSFLWTINEEDQTPLPSRPQHTFLSAFTYCPLDDWELNVRARAVSDSYVADAITSPAFLKVDVTLSRRFAKYFQAFARVLNVLDAKEDPYGLGDQRPVIGRLFSIGLQASYEEDEETEGM